MSKLTDYRIIPQGLEGSMHLGPEDSKKYNLHVHQVVSHLEVRGALLKSPLTIDVQLDPKGVIITWEEKNKKEENN